ncbi:MAG: hypothetical protein SFX73_14105 [Kofleriaceae bacterium]|nr:hypothetical protein [Kofleriaceae bacterium]
MKLASLVIFPSVACILFWLGFTACVIEAPDEPPPPSARILIAWDTSRCVDPHRLVVELEDEDGVDISSSAPCWLGAVTLDAPRWGIYRGRLYAWVLDEPIRAVAKLLITVDAPVVRWQLTTPL